MYWFVIQYFGTMRIDRYRILWYDCRVCCVNIVEGAITMQYTDNEAALIGGLIGGVIGWVVNRKKKKAGSA